MAAAHITKQFPQFDLYHIYDSNIPTIGVGEGTQADFPHWLKNITYFLEELLVAKDMIRKPFSQEKIKTFNQFLFNTILRIVLFISWHYKCGSCFDTKFWRFAKTNFESELAKINNPNLLQEFERFLQAGANFNFFQYFSASGSTFAGIGSISFYEVGTGIGYYENMNNYLPQLVKK